jgi:hypothetical protein
MIAPLTVTLHGHAAVSYVRATGTAFRLRRAEVRYSPGIIEPARILVPDEAHELLVRDGSEHARISCVAEHGERPYRGAGPIEIDWPSIHAAALVVDAERRIGLGTYDATCLGYDGLADAFGGSYSPDAYELAGLAGAVRLLHGAQQIRHAAWDAIHRSSRVVDGRRLATCAIRTALALDHLFRALAAVGIYVYDPAHQICGVTGYGPDDTVQVTGMRWLAGAAVESESPPTMREVAEFLESEVRS